MFLLSAARESGASVTRTRLQRATAIVALAENADCSTIRPDNTGANEGDAVETGRVDTVDS